MMPHDFPTTIPPLISGGVMLTYHCNSACRHCLYRCSPRQPDEWMSLERAERVFHALKRERYLDSLHIAGGEATLNLERLCEIIALAVRMDLSVAYLETNAAWCVEPGETREILRALKRAGLPCLMVSASMFHNEFIPFERTRACVEAAREVFGPGGLFVWLPELYDQLARLPEPERTHSLKEFCQHTGQPEWSPRLPAMYHVVAVGRAPEGLRRCYRACPAERFKDQQCGELLDTEHFHIDLHGNLITGLCAGIAVGTADNLHPEIGPEVHPVFCTLLTRGPWGLAELARERHGFNLRENGYVSKCDLCLDARRCLFASGEYI